MESDEKELIGRARKGDANAWRRLVERYYEMMFAVAYGILNDREEAKDAVQETFLKAFRRLKSFEGKSKFSSWLYRIAANTAIDAARKRRPAESLNAEAEAEGGGAPLERLEDRAPGPREEASAEERKRLVRRALLALTPEHRAILVLREWEGMSYEEIATTLDIDAGTVMSRLHYARKKMGEILNLELEEEDR